MTQETYQTLLTFFKVMGNTYRVRIAAALMVQAHTAVELGEMLDLKQATVLEHIAALRELGLVAAQPSTSNMRYSFDQKALQALNKALLSRESLPTPVDTIGDVQTRKVLRNMFEGDRLIMLPANPRKLRLLVEWLVTCFEESTRYSEQQVNAIIMRYHEDYATLRRAMIEEGLMQREHGVYWRIQPENA